MDQFTSNHSVHTINAQKFPTLAIHIFNRDYDKALKHLYALDRDNLFDTLLYSGLGIKGEHAQWISNITAELQQACAQGFIADKPIFEQIRAQLN